MSDDHGADGHLAGGEMDSAALRAVQQPLKDAYRGDPQQAVITLEAHGVLGEEEVSCSVSTGRAMAVAGLHPATGGDGSLACSGDMLLQALVACAGVTLRAVATSLELPVRGGTVRAEGDLDFRGTLGVSKDAAGRVHRHPAELRPRHRRQRRAGGHAAPAHRALLRRLPDPGPARRAQRRRHPHLTLSTRQPGARRLMSGRRRLPPRQVPGSPPGWPRRRARRTSRGPGATGPSARTGRP